MRVFRAPSKTGSGKDRVRRSGPRQPPAGVAGAVQREGGGRRIASALRAGHQTPGSRASRPAARRSHVDVSCPPVGRSWSRRRCTRRGRRREQRRARCPRLGTSPAPQARALIPGVACRRHARSARSRRSRCRVRITGRGTRGRRMPEDGRAVARVLHHPLGTADVAAVLGGGRTRAGALDDAADGGHVLCVAENEVAAATGDASRPVRRRRGEQGEAEDGARQWSEHVHLRVRRTLARTALARAVIPPTSGDDRGDAGAARRAASEPTIGPHPHRGYRARNGSSYDLPRRALRDREAAVVLRRPLGPAWGAGLDLPGFGRHPSRRLTRPFSPLGLRHDRAVPPRAAVAMRRASRWRASGSP